MSCSSSVITCSSSGEGGGGGGEGEGGGEGGGGRGGCEGGGGEGGGGGDDGYEHTRQPVTKSGGVKLSEYHSHLPGPKMKLEGPLFHPAKVVNDPDGWLGMRRRS